MIYEEACSYTDLDLSEDDSFDEILTKGYTYPTYTKLQDKWSWSCAAPTDLYGKLRHISDFSTAEDFWSIYNNLASIYLQLPGSKYIFTKKGKDMPTVSAWPDGGRIFAKCESADECRDMMLDTIRGEYPVEGMMLTKRAYDVSCVIWLSKECEIPGLRYVPNTEKIIGQVISRS